MFFSFLRGRQVRTKTMPQCVEYYYLSKKLHDKQEKGKEDERQAFDLEQHARVSRAHCRFSASLVSMFPFWALLFFFNVLSWLCMMESRSAGQAVMLYDGANINTKQCCFLQATPTYQAMNRPFSLEEVVPTPPLTSFFPCKLCGKWVKLSKNAN